ncbi:hypothetical protein [Sphingobacterium composti Ten et al. 2007 non Yoo et al. 2007]|uniref:hypothetical protein n=1 Tax=Sphingobacterium composti TaxID=363260 RepID=UPI0013597F92|nr:hypothetical protein [Sphingobacterium composti Ten et al. 2007 non Yoo et al. 2007]
MKEINTYNEELGGKNLPDSLRVNPFFTPQDFFEEQENVILNQIRLYSAVGNHNEDSLPNATSAVPDGYFDTLENSIFAKIAEHSLKDKVAQDGFSVPEQYFYNLNQNIESAVAEEYLKSQVPTLDFETPIGYFDNAEEQIFAKIAEINIQENVGKETGYIVPNQYFEHSANEIEATIKLDQWSRKSENNSFHVPVGYFEQLTTSILDKTTNASKKETSIIVFPKLTNWRKYSAAAAIALLVGIGSYFGIQNISSTSQMQQHIITTDVNLENISDEEILSYLAQVSEGGDLIQLAEFASDVNIVEENAQLDSNIEDDEIEDYLNYML